MSTRSWPYAVGASLVLHLVVLGALFSRRLPVAQVAPREPTPLTVMRVAVAARAAALSPQPPANLPSSRAPSATPPSSRSETPHPHVESLGDRAVAQPDDAQPVAVAQAGGQPAAEPGPTPGAASAGEGAPTEAPAAPSSPEVDATPQLHARLAAAARACYPAALKRFRVTGVSVVSFCVEPDGAASKVQRVRSSGNDVLDTAALDCVVPHAAPFTVAAAGRCFEVPVSFGSEP